MILIIILLMYHVNIHMIGKNHIIWYKQMTSMVMVENICLTKQKHMKHSRNNFNSNKLQIQHLLFIYSLISWLYSLSQYSASILHLWSFISFITLSTNIKETKFNNKLTVIRTHYPILFIKVNQNLNKKNMI